MLRAFTLVEFLIASAVGVVVALLAALALQSGFAAWARLATESRGSLEAARLLARIERDIASSLPLLDKSFEGMPDALRTTRLIAADDAAHPGTPVQVEWRFDAAAATVVRSERRLGDPDEATIRNEEFTPVPSLRFAYMGAPAPPATVPVWQDAWVPPTHTGVPNAVRIVLLDAQRILPCYLRPATEIHTEGAP